jgi:hypothetical protein
MTRGMVNNRISRSNHRTFNIDDYAHPTTKDTLEKWRKEGVNVSDRICGLIDQYEAEREPMATLANCRIGNNQEQEPQTATLTRAEQFHLHIRKHISVSGNIKGRIHEGTDPDLALQWQQDLIDYYKKNSGICYKCAELLEKEQSELEHDLERKRRVERWQAERKEEKLRNLTQRQEYENRQQQQASGQEKTQENVEISQR